MFKVGDKVRCKTVWVDSIEDGKCTAVVTNEYAKDNLKIGNIYTVTNIFSNNRWFSLEESRYNHPIDYFELIEEVKHDERWGKW